jgi:hypothetical protein
MWHRDFIAEQHDAIAVYLRWRNQHATPKQGFAVDSKDPAARIPALRRLTWRDQAGPSSSQSPTTARSASVNPHLGSTR